MENFIFCAVFFLSVISFTITFAIHKTAGEGGDYLFNSSLPLPLASQTLRHQPGNYCRELTSAHSQQPDSNGEPLVSESKPLTTKLYALKYTTQIHWDSTQNLLIRKRTFNNKLMVNETSPCGFETPFSHLTFLISHLFGARSSLTVRELPSVDSL